MSAPLRVHELAAMERTLRVMLAPLAHPNVASWARELCETARGLVPEPVHGSLYMAGGDETGLVHTTMDPDIPRQYFTHWWTRDEHMLELVRRRLTVGHTLMVCSAREYYDSAVYQEYVRRTGMDLSIGLSAYRVSGASPRLLLTYEGARSHGDLERAGAVLGTLAPAFTTGVAAWLATRELAQAGDAPALVCDARGRVLHETPALAVLLAGVAPAVAAQVRAAAQALAVTTGVVVLRRRASAGEALAALEAAPGAVRTAGGTFRLRCTVAPAGLDSAAATLLVAVEGPGTAPPSVGVARVATDDAALRERFGLTAQELHVARLMAERRTDAEIGTALGISPHTARTHAERVRRKLGGVRRPDVARALASVNAAN
jgi:DNA-binding CsgD family transcriptional regulator